jgi:hypothetical protein
VKEDYIKFEEDKLKMVSLFKYRAITMQTTGSTYTQYIKYRKTAYKKIIQDIKNLIWCH